jgi:ribose/xylose/arabinose/galactoside ABC-type transport system permease subunit
MNEALRNRKIYPVDSPPGRTALAPSRWAADFRRTMMIFVRVVAIAALVIWALTTNGLLTRISLLSLLTSVSFIGCTAIGMTFITISGNIMSLSLGATGSVCAMVFLAALDLGLPGAIICAMLAGIAISGLQGFIVGYLKANGILISIAALALILGTADVVTGSERIYAAGTGTEILKGSFAGVPVVAFAFVACLAIAQVVLSFTVAGRAMLMVGSNWRAAEVMGLHNGVIVTVAYVFAGVFATISGVLLAARYGSADMDLGGGYDYGAISAVLVGGTSIHGGSGSILQTGLGCVVIALVQSTLLLRGYSQEMQYLITGLIVLGVILLQSAGKGRRA